MRLRDCKVNDLTNDIKEVHLNKQPKTLKEAERNEYIKWLQSLDTKHHLTLTMSKGTSEQNAVAFMNDLIKMLNIKIFKKRYTRDQSSHLDGVVVMEDTPKQETVHFHCLIQYSSYIPNKERLESLIQNILSSNKKGGGDHLAEFKIDDYYLTYETSIEKYLTKIFESWESIQTIRDRFGYLGPNKVEFGGIKALSQYSGGSFRCMPNFTAAA